MFELSNETRYEATLSVHLDREGAEWVAVTVKATFSVIGRDRLTVAPVQEPVYLQDQYSGDPGTSSVAVPIDITPFKPSTDVMLVGHAFVPGGVSARAVDVMLEVGPVKKTVRVFGDRIWKRGLFRYKPSRPTPFERMPLVYERAFGGSDPHVPPNSHSWDARNPVGIGLRARGGRTLRGQQLPNLEAPNEPIRRWRDRPAPQGFGPIDRAWEPRRSYAGTYDQTWQTERAPLLPDDFDYRFHQCAHPDLVAPGYLKGDERVRIVNATRDGEWCFTLPGQTIGVAVRANRMNSSLVARLTTVLLVPDQCRVVLVWTGMVPVRRKLTEIDRIAVFSLPLAAADELGELPHDEERPSRAGVG